jgi:hypothetical protein
MARKFDNETIVLQRGTSNLKGKAIVNRFIDWIETL